MKEEREEGERGTEGEEEENTFSVTDLQLSGVLAPCPRDVMTPQTP